MVTALYIDPRGPYPKLCDSWDETRDARTFNGPGPVVAHPPCGPWGALRHLYEGAEHDCGPRAVEQVRRFGGVLEHPKGSKLWDALDLPKPYPHQGDPLPFPFRDAWGGFSIQIDQVEWGHVARKATWLYIVGLEPADVLAAVEQRPHRGRQPTHWVSGRRAAQPGASKAREKGWTGGAAPAGIKICSANLRRRTPLAFAKWLIALASRAHP
jgi:hypothetical protein